MTSSNDDLLFAEHALRRGLVLEEQVDEVLRIQEKVAEMGVPDSLPSLMVKRGLLEQKDADAVLSQIRPRDRKEQIEGYRLLRRLGHGGMGSVYLARQVAMDRLVALKVLKPSLTKDKQQVERLRREATLVGKLSHPNIVRGLDMGESGGFHYFAMDYIEGETLRDLLKSGKPLREVAALTIVRDVAEALDHAWSHRIAHRDVKPGNILVRPNSHALLMDYGLAKGPLDLSLTQTGTTLGTPQYLSPEQARNPRSVDIRTDLYALGATLFHMLTGRVPFTGENLAEVVTQVLMKPHAPPQSINTRISANAAFLIDRLMAKDPRHRYQTPRELIRDLDAIEKGRSIVPAGWEGDWKTFVLRRRYRRLAVAAAILVVLAMTAAGYLWYGSWQQEKEQERHDLEQARVEVSVRGAGVGFEGIEAWHVRLVELERLHAEQDPAFRAHRETFDRVVELKKRILAGRALGAAPDDHASRLARYGQLLVAAEGLPVVEDHLKGMIETARGDARRAADEAYRKVRQETYLTLEDFEKKLTGLDTRLEKNWPADLRGDVPARIARDRTAVRRLIVTRTETATRCGTDLETLGPAGRFQKARDNLDEKLAAIREDLEVDEAVRTVPGEVADRFQGDLEKLEKRIEDEDAEAFRTLRDTYSAVHRESNEPSAFASGVRELRERAGYALKDSASAMEDLADRLEARAAERRQKAETLCEGRLNPTLPTHLRNRELEAASRLVEEVALLKEPEEGWEIAPWVAVKLDLARSDLAVVTAFWERLLTTLAEARGRTVENLKDEETGIGPGRVEIVSVEGWILKWRDAEGRTGEVNLRRLALSSALLHAGLADPERGDDSRMAGIVLLLLEPGSTENLLAEIRRLEKVQGLLGAGGATRYEQEVKRRLEAPGGLRDRQEEREKDAKELFDEAEDYFDAGRWKEALESFQNLGKLPRYRHTRFYLEARDETAVWIGRCNAKIAGDEASQARFRAGRLEFLEGFENLLANRALAALTLPLDTDEERADLGVKDGEGLIRAVPFEGDPVGPPAPDAEPAAPGERRVLALLQGDTLPEFLENRPVVIENPFLASAPMALEVDVRSPRPVFLAISLAGFIVGILSADDRVDGGRGVAFWMGKDLTRLDTRIAELQALRRRAVERELDPERRPPGEIRRLKETRYFRMEPDRWYRLRIEKTDRDLTLRADGVVVMTWDLPRKTAPDRGRIALLTYTTTHLDNLRIEGTVDRQWWLDR